MARRSEPHRGGHLVEVIRLVKYLRDYKGTFGVKSVILTTLLGNAVNFANILGDADYYRDMPTALRNVVSDLDRYLQANRYLPVIADPSCPTEDFNHRWDQDGYANFRNKIHVYAEKIDAAYTEADRDASVALWQDIFGNDFKKSPETTNLAAAAVPATSNTERFIDRDLGFSFASTRYRLRIVGRVQPKRGFRTYDLPNQGNRVHKGRSLRFRITVCDVPPPYEV